jgi:hypothetical protein
LNFSSASGFSGFRSGCSFFASKAERDQNLLRRKMNRNDPVRMSDPLHTIGNTHDGINDGLMRSFADQKAFWVAAFAQRLSELGWTEGRNVDIEYRWAAGNSSRMAALASEFVQQKVDVIVTSSYGAVAAKGCCPCAASGQARAPPSKAINSRRLMDRSFSWQVAVYHTIVTKGPALCGTAISNRMSPLGSNRRHLVGLRLSNICEYSG